jgi:hypothetical protein
MRQYLSQAVQATNSRRRCDSLGPDITLLLELVWDEAENRMHPQKALLQYLLLGRDVE